MENIIKFFKTSITPIFGTHHLRVWHVTVAAVLLIVLIVIAIAVARKKKPAAQSDAVKANSAPAAGEKVAPADGTPKEPTFSPVTEPEKPVVSAEKPAERQPEEKIKEEKAESDEQSIVKEQEEKPVSLEKASLADAEPEADEKEEKVKKSADNSVKAAKPAQKAENKKNTAAAAKPAAKSAAKSEKSPAKKLNGKWHIVRKKEDEYIAELLASNGEVMLTSEAYSSPEGAKKGIATIIKGVDGGNFIIYRDKGDNYYYKLKSASNKLLCVGEIYTSKDGCVSATETVKRIAKDSPVLNGVIDGKEYVAYTPEATVAEAKKGARGKWKIEKGELGYSARLYANNGQLMMATEEVKEKSTAASAVASVKKNSADGNFIIDKDKFGRFYYKLRNSQKSVICIGEAYDTLDACISALESVRKFAEYSDVVADSEPATAKPQQK